MFTKWYLFLNKNASPLIDKVRALLLKRGDFFGEKILLRVILLSLVSPILVVLISTAFFYQQNCLNEKMIDLEKKVKSLVNIRKLEGKFIKKFISSDVNFLEHYVSTLPLLKEDVELIEKIGKQVNYQPLQERLNFLESGKNQIEFKSQSFKKSNLYNETEWKMDHPVEVSVKDILQVVSLVEGVKMYQFIPNLLRPQLIIKKLSLKAKSSGNGESFFLDLEILQRNANEKN